MPQVDLKFTDHLNILVVDGQGYRDIIKDVGLRLLASMGLGDALLTLLPIT